MEQPFEWRTKERKRGTRRKEDAEERRGGKREVATERPKKGAEKRTGKKIVRMAREGCRDEGERRALPERILPASSRERALGTRSTRMCATRILPLDVFTSVEGNGRVARTYVAISRRETLRCGTRARIYGVHPRSLSRFDVYSFREEPELRLRSYEHPRLRTDILKMRTFTYFRSMRDTSRSALPLSNKRSTVNPVEGLLLSIFLC